MRKIVVVLVAVLAVCATESRAQPPGSAPGRRDSFRQGRPFGPPSPLVEAIDANRDGELSADEIAGASQALKKLDKSGDGKLSREELRPQPPGRQGPGGVPRKFPGGMAPFGPGGPGGPGGPPPREAGEQASLEASPTSKDNAEAAILKALEEIPKEQGWNANVPPSDGRLLRLVTEAIGAKNVVEIGTSNGISSIWIAMALRTTGGKLVTHEIDPATAAMARKNFAAAGVSQFITLVEGDAHQTVAKLTGPIDVVFIDADKEGYLDYFQKVLPLVRSGGVIFAHNMTPGRADPEFVKAITTAPGLETLFYMQGGGMSVTLKKR